MIIRRHFVWVFVLTGCGSLLGIDGDYVEVTDASVGAAEAGAGDGAIPQGDSVDAGCDGHICEGVCLPGTDCSTCAKAPLYCASTGRCMNKCDGCQDRTIDCFSCSPTPRGSCEPSDSAYCLGGEYMHCSCPDGGAGACPGASDVCVAGQCERCGTSGADTDEKRCAKDVTKKCASERQRCED